MVISAGTEKKMVMIKVQTQTVNLEMHESIFITVTALLQFLKYGSTYYKP
jgi:hypothetical protein